ncbi:hypothetical protein N7499_005038 [Penicillium canescens]|nr:hypothetical protein N7499_005038 [Penicillium canescens]KAJ6162188.1 hypothetical protein N7485_010418 [Penicillium canescens]
MNNKIDRSALPRRQSCDRCHRQKLRCVRQGSSSTTGVCDRCLRQGAPCVYSFSLPKGRRSTYAGNAGAPSDSPTSRSARANPTCTPTYSPNLAPELPAETSSEPVSAARTPLLPIPEHRNVNARPSFLQLEETGHEALRSMAWLENVEFGLDAMGTSTTHGTDVSETQCHTGFEAFLNGTGFEDIHMSDIENMSSWSEQESVKEVYLRHHGISTDQEPVSRPRSQNHEHRPRQALENPTPPEYTRDNINLVCIDDGIAQLSQLSSHLYTLYRASYDLTATIGSCGPESRRVPLFDDQALISATTWLSAPNININTYPPRSPSLALIGPAAGPLSTPTTPENTLINTLSASHYLLQVLHQLQSLSIPTTQGPPYPDLDEDVGIQKTSRLRSSSLSSTTTNSSGGMRDSGGSQHSGTVIRHLIIACYSLVLRMWSALLVALQHDAELSAESTSFPNTGKLDREADEDTPQTSVLANMRLVVVVHLSSYLVDRLRNALHTYLALKATGSADQGLSELESEFRQLLRRLRRTLHS